MKHLEALITGEFSKTKGSQEVSHEYFLKFEGKATLSKIVQ